MMMIFKVVTLFALAFGVYGETLRAGVLNKMDVSLNVNANIFDIQALQTAGTLGSTISSFVDFPSASIRLSITSVYLSVDAIYIYSSAFSSSCQYNWTGISNGVSNAVLDYSTIIAANSCFSDGQTVYLVEGGYETIANKLVEYKYGLLGAAFVIDLSGAQASIVIEDETASGGSIQTFANVYVA